MRKRYSIHRTQTNAEARKPLGHRERFERTQRSVPTACHTTLKCYEDASDMPLRYSVLQPGTSHSLAKEAVSLRAGSIRRPRVSQCAIESRSPITATLKRDTKRKSFRYERGPRWRLRRSGLPFPPPHHCSDHTTQHVFRTPHPALIG